MKIDLIIERAKEISNAANTATSTDDLRGFIIDLADVVAALATSVALNEGTARRAANVADCLANGIQPD